MSEPTPEERVEECWAEEGGVRVRIENLSNGRALISFTDANGTVVSSASVASFRRDRLAAALELGLLNAAVEAEREACALKSEAIADEYCFCMEHDGVVTHYHDCAKPLILRISAAIRARDKEKA